MGRVNRLMERRVLRRAADEALLTPAFVRSIDIPPGTASRVDTASHVDDADPGGSEPDTDPREPLDAITEPIAVTALQGRLRNSADDVELDDMPATARAADLPASAAVGTWEPTVIEPRRVRVGPPWYRTKPVAALAAIAAAAIVASAVLLVSRGSEQTTTVAPEASTTAAPHPSSGRPAPSSAPPAASNPPSAPPPPLPPPPASPPPVRNDNSWTPNPPSPTKKPEIGVTRAPSFSATPPPPPAPGKNSATPGDAPPHHWGFW
ncbi:hypothetical protein [Mycolicibacterium moriokaense]|uniref:hypothetical protein n=1 Tax=Mycolicibacterium moriokaense TaxID=39691 RepID=UPI0015E8C3C7|nr:hypothetical protein [Mycolicibacterium moriokaense]